MEKHRDKVCKIHIVIITATTMLIINNKKAK